MGDEVVQGVDAEVPTAEEVKKLKYTRAVFYETLRLYPTVPHFPRVAAKDSKLGGYDVPKGATVAVIQSALNRSDKLWKQPESFQPERFMAESVKDPITSKPVGVPGGSEYGFIPFGAGQRTCIGQRFALLEG